jgi:hypothetical protein
MGKRDKVMGQAIQEKSQVLQFALTLVLGPIGLLYGSPAAGITLFICAMLLALGSGGFGALLVWPISIGFGFFAINRGNRRLMNAEAPPELIELPVLALAIAMKPIADD